MADKEIFSAELRMKPEDVKNFVTLLEMNKLDAELDDKKSSKLYSVQIIEKGKK